MSFFLFISSPSLSLQPILATVTVAARFFLFALQRAQLRLFLVHLNTPAFLALIFSCSETAIIVQPELAPAQSSLGKMQALHKAQRDKPSQENF
jgi:hypothetical protein